MEASVYDALAVLPSHAFDLVFTGIGALCWIPDIRRWAGVVAGLLAPGGRLFLREAHPMLNTLDDNVPPGGDGKLVVKYPYFERGAQLPLVFDEGSTYVQHEPHEFENTKSAAFTHGLGEIVQALLDAGLRVTGLKEHQSVPWNAIPGQMTDIGGGELATHTHATIYSVCCYDDDETFALTCEGRRIRAEERALESATVLHPPGCEAVAPVHTSRNGLPDYQKGYPTPILSHSSCMFAKTQRTCSSGLASNTATLDFLNAQSLTYKGGTTRYIQSQEAKIKRNDVTSTVLIR